MGKLSKIGWHVLYVKSRHEIKVDKLLKENEVESFLPMIKTIRNWSDRKKTIEVPLFSSYVFVNIKSSLDLHKALSVDGACAYIRFGSEYAIVKQQEIDQIKFIVGEKDITDIEIDNNNCKVGDIKRIQYGALNGVECEILNVNNVNKIIVRVKSLQQNIKATIPSCYLKEISEVA